MESSFFSIRENEQYGVKLKFPLFLSQTQPPPLPYEIIPLSFQDSHINPPILFILVMHNNWQFDISIYKSDLKMDHFSIEGDDVSDYNNDGNSNIADSSKPNSQILNRQSTSASLQTYYDNFDIVNCVLTIIFKILTIVFYLLMKILTESYLGTFVGTVLLISIDFWVTKNLTGRKLVGLRWWSQITDNDEQQWVFESRSQKRIPHGANQNVFWFSQILFVMFWFIILLLNFFTLSLFWIGLGVFCVLLASINFVCYFKCRGEHQKKVQQLSNKLGLNIGSQMF